MMFARSFQRLAKSTELCLLFSDLSDELQRKRQSIGVELRRPALGVGDH